MAQPRRQVHEFVRPRWSRWLQAALDLAGMTDRELGACLVKTRGTNPTGSYTKLVRRWIHEAVTPESATVFEVGQAIREHGLPWCSGVVSLYAAGYIGDAYGLIYYAASTNEVDDDRDGLEPDGLDRSRAAATALVLPALAFQDSLVYLSDALALLEGCDIRHDLEELRKKQVRKRIPAPLRGEDELALLRAALVIADEPGMPLPLAERAARVLTEEWIRSDRKIAGAPKIRQLALKAVREQGRHLDYDPVASALAGRLPVSK
jgi:hypothetical protein